MISYSLETGKMTQEAAEEYFNLKNYLLEVIMRTPIMGIFTGKKNAD